MMGFLKRRVKEVISLGVFSLILGMIFFVVLRQTDFAKVLEYTLIVLGLILILAGVFSLGFSELKAWFLNKKTQTAINAFLSSFIIIALLGVIAYLTNRYSYSVDLTRGKKYSLSKQSVAILKKIKDPIMIYAFYKKDDPELDNLKELLENYRRANSNIRVEILDPYRNLKVVKTYNITQYGTIYIKNLRTKLDIRVVEPSEEKITNAILNITRKNKRVVYFIVGHGELSLDNESKGDGVGIAKRELSGMGYDVRKLSLIEKGKVPSDADIVVIAGPKSPYMDAEKKAISEYLDNGGSLIVMMDPDSKAGIENLLKEYGIEFDNDVIIDPASRILTEDYFLFPYGASYEYEPITKGFKSFTFFYYARSLKDTSAVKYCDVNSIVKTNPKAWGETGELKGEVKYDKGDVKGPLSIAVISECELAKKLNKKGIKKKARVIAVGDSDFISNKFYRMLGNGILFQKMIFFLAKDKELISIPEKKKIKTYLDISPFELRFIEVLFVYILPLLVVVFGFYSWSRRKNL